MKSAKEKMLSQKFYISWDIELTAEREKAKSILFEFNKLNPSKRNERAELLRKLIPTIGNDPWIESPFNCDYGTNLAIGNHFYSNTNCTLLDCAKITIGDNVLFGPNVSLYTPNHAFHAGERKDGWEQSLPITIGNNVWLGGSVTVIGGVTIGKNTIIGAGSVVTKDIPADVLAVGNPCKVVRKINEQDKISFTDSLK